MVNYININVIQFYYFINNNTLDLKKAPFIISPSYSSHEVRVST